MKKITSIIIFAAALLAAACTGSKQSPEAVVTPEAGMVFSGSLIPGTRSTFLDETLTTLKWEDTDDIGVYALRWGTTTPDQVAADGTVSRYAITGDIDLPGIQQSPASIVIDSDNPTFALFYAPKSSAEFMPARDQAGVEDVYAYFAYYPLRGASTWEFSTEGSDPGVIGVVPYLQDGTEFGRSQICVAGKFESLYARSALVSGQTRVNFNFEPVTALIRFRMKLASDCSYSSIGNVRKMMITLPNGNLFGNVLLSPHMDDAWWAIPVSTDNDAHSVSVSFTGSYINLISFTDYFYAVVLPTYNKTVQEELTFVVYDNNDQPVLFAKKQLPVHTEGSDTSYGFRQGKIYTLDLELSEFTAEAVAGKYNPYDWE